MAKITNEIGYRNMDPNGGIDLYLELNLEGDSTSSTHRTLSFSTGGWQRGGRGGFDSYISIGYYNYTGASRDTMYANIGAYESSGVRGDSKNSSFYTEKAVDGSGNGDENSEGHEYYEPKLSVSIPFERTSSDYYVMLAGYSGYQDCTVLSDGYLIPAKQLQPDTPDPQTKGDVIYYPMGGVYTGQKQTKEKNINLTLNLNASQPTRAGFTFTGGNTQPDGNGTHYNFGGTYNLNQPLMLFAQGTKNSSIISNIKYVTKQHFNNFVDYIKPKLKPNNMSAYIINENVVKSINNNTANADKNGWGQYRHWSDGIAEAGGYCGGQTSTTETNTQFYTELPKGIFVDHPSIIMTPQIHGMQGAFTYYQDAHTLDSGDTSDTNRIGLTYINSYLKQDTNDSGKGKNCYIRYYLRGRGMRTATITANPNSGYTSYIIKDNEKYITSASFLFVPGEKIIIKAAAIQAPQGRIYINDDNTPVDSSGNEYEGTLPNADVSIVIQNVPQQASVKINY